MQVFIGADADGFELKGILAQYLSEQGYEVCDLTPTAAADCVDAAVTVGKELLAHEGTLGFVIDRYGAGSYMAACKMKGLIACECSDERSAFMTREHNNARMICMGAGIVGVDLAKNIAVQFLEADYAAGRHQIRVDMLNKMA